MNMLHSLVSHNVKQAFHYPIINESGGLQTAVQSDEICL